METSWTFLHFLFLPFMAIQSVELSRFKQCTNDSLRVLCNNSRTFPLSLLTFLEHLILFFPLYQQHRDMLLYLSSEQPQHDDITSSLSSHPLLFLPFLPSLLHLLCKWSHTSSWFSSVFLEIIPMYYFFRGKQERSSPKSPQIMQLSFTHLGNLLGVQRSLCHKTFRGNLQC